MRLDSDSDVLGREGVLRLSPLTIAIGVVVGWFAVFAKVGSGLIYGIDDLLPRVKAFPDLLVTGDATVDYKNWSILPLALGKLFGAGTARSFAFLQFVILLVGTVGVLYTVARKRPQVATGALLGFFATMVPSWLLFSMGTYDQLLAVLLLAATLVDRRLTACICGLLLGLTHAEAAAVAVLGLAALSLAAVGPRVAVRLWTLGGIVASRLALTVWFRIEGQSGDRFTFVTEFGLGKLIGFFLDTWPCVLWSAAAGGWLIIARQLLRPRSRRLATAIGCTLLLNVLATAVTADQSRVIMLTTLPLVVALAAFPPPGPTSSLDATLDRYTLYGATLVGLLAPMTISWIGALGIAGRPFHLSW